MKSSIHPKEYRLVVFSDEAAGFSFLTKSTAPSEETIKWEDGNEYPLVKVHISSASHPFFTGEEKIIDTEGRVDRFKKQAEAAKKHQAEMAKKVAAKKTKKVAKKPVKKVKEAESKPATKAEKLKKSAVKAKKATKTESKSK
jgi:large subunit ribosomal protein L31